MSKDNLEKLYFTVKSKLANIALEIVLYTRIIIRLLALPYCYFKMVDWGQCKATRYQVIKDFCFIFFQLKYFPGNYSICRLWEKHRDNWKYYYGSSYDPYQRMRLQKEVQKKEYEIIFKDKYICYQLCKSFNLPLPEQFACISPGDNYKKEIHNILINKPTTKLIIKPVQGKGGENIVLVYHGSKDIVVRNGDIELSLETYNLITQSVIQVFITQHEHLSRYSLSTNTVRIVTLLTKSNDVLILGSFIRFGVNNAYIDNTCSGGISVGINIHSGRLNEIGSDTNGKIYLNHPNSKISFKDFQIPFWEQVVDLAIKTQEYFACYKLLGHDIAITDTGPILIEINSAFDIAELEQDCGPILSNHQIIAAFKEYDLLINKYQHQIHNENEL
jgi:hypothetical protein